MSHINRFEFDRQIAATLQEMEITSGETAEVLILEMHQLWSTASLGGTGSVPDQLDQGVLRATVHQQSQVAAGRLTQVIDGRAPQWAEVQAEFLKKLGRRLESPDTPQALPVPAGKVGWPGRLENLVVRISDLRDWVSPHAVNHAARAELRWAQHDAYMQDLLNENRPEDPVSPEDFKRLALISKLLPADLAPHYRYRKENRVRELAVVTERNPNCRVSEGTTIISNSFGEPMHIWHLTIEPQGRIKGTVLIGCGYQAKHSGYLRYAEEMVAQGYRVRIYDQPSQGFSERDPYVLKGERLDLTGHVRDMDVYKRAMEAELDRASRDFPGSPLKLVVHSMGGQIATDVLSASTKWKHVHAVFMNPNLLTTKKLDPLTLFVAGVYGANGDLLVNRERAPQLPDGKSTVNDLENLGVKRRRHFYAVREAGNGWTFTKMKAHNEALRNLAAEGKLTIHNRLLVVHAFTDTTSASKATDDVFSKGTAPRANRLPDTTWSKAGHYAMTHVETHKPAAQQTRRFFDEADQADLNDLAGRLSLSMTSFDESSIETWAERGRNDERVTNYFRKRGLDINSVADKFWAAGALMAGNTDASVSLADIEAYPFFEEFIDGELGEAGVNALGARRFTGVIQTGATAGRMGRAG